MADPNIPAVDGISDADVARVLLYQGQRSVHAPLTGVVSKAYVESLDITKVGTLESLTVTGAAALNGGVTVDGKEIIMHDGQTVRAFYPDDTHYGYFAGFNASGQNGFFIGYGNGSTTVEFILDSASILAFSGADYSFSGSVTVTGSVLSESTVTARATALNGFVQLSSGSDTLPGFVPFFSPDNTRRGYLGWANGDYLAMVGENGWGWRVAAGTEFRVSGDFLAEGVFGVNTETPYFTGLSSSGILAERATDGAVVTFAKPFPFGPVGNITISGTSTAYNTTSDYRLKQNYEPISDALDRIAALTAYRGEFIADPGRKVDYFLAHEAQEVVPEAVTGEKDAVDEDGKPVYQGIDQSKLVPLHHAAIQALLAKIKTLEARVAALESA